MTDAPARIIVQRGNHGDQEHDLVHIQTSIGRSPDNDLSIPDPEVSRRHSLIVQQGSTYLISDAGSTNGTFVNEKRVTGSMALHHGDVIRLGDAITLRFYQRQTEQPTLMDAAPIIVPDDEDTAPLPPLPPEMLSAQPSPAPLVADPYQQVEAQPSPQRRLVLGCVTVLILFCLCGATVYFLDSYENGRLLYCGALRPFWELVLGPFGFSPLCP